MSEQLRALPQALWSFFDHLHAPRVRVAALRFRATFFGGLLSTALFVILTVTGVLLMYVYVPSENAAWESMQALEQRVRYGRMLRALHNWTAQAMVVTVVLHLLSLAWRGAFHRKKLLNWWVGVILFFLTVALSYTGYLLPWDQLAYWAVTVGGNMAASAPVVGEHVQQALLGGPSISGTTLLRFYVHHCITLPLILAVLLSVHLFRIRRDGGLSLTERAEAAAGGAVTRSRSAIMRWEIWLTLLVTLLAVILSFWQPIPLGPEADPEITPNPMKAPWYLVGLQELLHFHPAFFVTYLVPGAFIGLLLSLPLLPERIKAQSLADLGRPTTIAVLGLLSLVALASTPLWAWHWNASVLLGCGLAALLLLLARGPWRACCAGLTLPVFLLGWLLSCYLGLTLVAVYLRGPDWSLVW